MKYLKLFESFANFDADMSDSIRDIMSILDIRSGNGWEWIDVKYKYDEYGNVTDVMNIDLIKNMSDSDQTFDIHEHTAVVPKICLKTKSGLFSIENKVCVIWKPEEEFEEYLAFFTDSDLDYDDKEKIEEMGFKYKIVKIYTDYKLKI